MCEKQRRYCLFDRDARVMRLKNATIVWATEHDEVHKRANLIDISKISLKDIYLDGKHIGGNVVLTGRSYKVDPSE